jgi:HK97 family phage major capsid protein
LRTIPHQRGIRWRKHWCARALPRGGKEKKMNTTTDDLTPEIRLANTQDMRSCLVEMDSLSHVERLTPQQRNRFQYLGQRVSALKSGFSVDALNRQQLNKLRQEDGLEPLEARDFGEDLLSPMTVEQRAEARIFREFCLTGDIRESRDETVGIPPVFVNLNGNNASLVPIGFLTRLIRSMAQHSPLFDPDKVSYLATETGAPVKLPWASDIEAVASVIGENSGPETETDLSFVGGATVQTWTYRTPRIRASYESVQDLGAAWNVENLLSVFFADRLSRGAGADLLLGNGMNRPFGLVPSIQATGAIVTAAGSSPNDGSTSSGANSIGQQDLLNLLYSVPAPYRRSPKFAFLMNSTTALALEKLTDKLGMPLNLIDMDLDQPRLFGKNIYFDESLENIGSSQTPVVAGDLSYWLTRITTNSFAVRRYTQSQGLAENFEFALDLLARVGGQFMHSDPEVPSPIWALQNHS